MCKLLLIILYVSSLIGFRLDNFGNRKDIEFSSLVDPEECYSFGKAFTDDSSFVNYLSRFSEPIVVREDFHIPQQ